jgi:SAM-dependent methyltransferase
MSNKLLDVSTHYEFGKNWSEFSETINERSIAEADKGILKLFPNNELAGKRVLDIGCGSGLHSLAALRQGAAEVAAIDIDPNSVATTRKVLGRFAPHDRWTVEVKSVFDMPDEPKFDVVYSWGVLHHTGDMYRAIERAAARVAPGGLFCLALYRKTKYCPMWKIEKRIYTQGGRPVRFLLEQLFLVAFKRSFRGSGRTFEDYKNDYVKYRGMDFMTDIRDWLGGYPYESISEDEMLAFASKLGFEPVRRFCETPGSGLLGTGCDEYVFRRPG